MTFTWPDSNLTKYCKSLYSTGIRLFGNVPIAVRSLNPDTKVFMSALKEYLLSHSYTVDGIVTVARMLTHVFS
jgi:hypothetical protein